MGENFPPHWYVIARALREKRESFALYVHASRDLGFKPLHFPAKRHHSLFTEGICGQTGPSQNP